MLYVCLHVRGCVAPRCFLFGGSVGGALESLIHAIGSMREGLWLSSAVPVGNHDDLGISTTSIPGATSTTPRLGASGPPSTLPGPFSRTLHLDLRGNGIGDGDVLALVDAIRHLPVSHVDLRHNSLTPGAVEDLAAALGFGPGTVLGTDAVEVETAAEPLPEEGQGPTTSGGGSGSKGTIVRIRGVRRGIVVPVSSLPSAVTVHPPGLLDGDGSVSSCVTTTTTAIVTPLLL
jgi:hypothetical protein